MTSFTRFDGISLAETRSLTIASGVIDVSQAGSNVVVDTESAAASDDLDTINLSPTPSSVPVEGAIIVLQAANSARTVVAKDGTGNLVLAGDFSLDNVEDRLVLMRTGSNFVELSRSNNGA